MSTHASPSRLKSCHPHKIVFFLLCFIHFLLCTPDRTPTSSSRVIAGIPGWDGVLWLRHCSRRRWGYWSWLGWWSFDNYDNEPEHYNDQYYSIIFTIIIMIISIIIIVKKPEHIQNVGFWLSIGLCSGTIIQALKRKIFSPSSKCFNISILKYILFIFI